MKHVFIFVISFLVLGWTGCISVSEEILCNSRWRMEQVESDAFSEAEREGNQIMTGRVSFTFAPNHHFIQWLEAEQQVEGVWEIAGKELSLKDGAGRVTYPTYKILELQADLLVMESLDDRGRTVKVTYRAVPK